MERIGNDVEQQLSRFGGSGSMPRIVAAWPVVVGDEIAIVSGSRELRSFGSQGEQRLAVLSLLLAEADLIAERRPSPPLLLLDDVLSELDTERRSTLTGRLPAGGQTLITATDRSALPREPDQLILVEPGTARTE